MLAEVLQHFVALFEQTEQPVVIVPHHVDGFTGDRVGAGTDGQRAAGRCVASVGITEAEPAATGCIEGTHERMTCHAVLRDASAQSERDAPSKPSRSDVAIFTSLRIVATSPRVPTSTSS